MFSELRFSELHNTGHLPCMENTKPVYELFLNRNSLS